MIQIRNGSEQDGQKFVCVFSDETNNTLRKTHINVSGSAKFSDFYQQVADHVNYKNGTFLLAHLVNNEEVILDKDFEFTIADLLSVHRQKRNNFLIKDKDGVSPVSQKIKEEAKENEDESSYVSDFFSLQGNGSTTKNISITNISDTGGYVGLVNQAMTCYLNSLLQTLYMTPEFRNAIYSWKFDGSSKNATTSIPYQLQKLFILLQTSKKRAVETKDLTKSFGWDGNEAWQQHDVQELCRVMFDALEENLKDTDKKDLIKKLYEGELDDYVKCLKCHHENLRKDKFLDISVDVRPFGSNTSYKSLEEALTAFVAAETLDGDNQYSCERCNSKQDAHKGLKFVNFPHLLTIQLKRFTFDPNTLQRIKLGDRVSFPFVLNLDEFIQPKQGDCPSEEKKTCDENEEKTEEISHTYELFSVLIHSGSTSVGHYYAYIKSFIDGKWYNFNDQYVSEISESEIEKSFGGDSVGSYYSSSYSRSTNAYMLMYRKISQHNETFINENDWPQHLKDLSQSLLKGETDHHLEQARNKELCKIKLIGFHPTSKEKISQSLQLHKDLTLPEATEKAWKELGFEKEIPLCRCRLVKYNDNNKSLEMSFQDYENKPISELLGGVRFVYGFDLMLECRNENEQFRIYEPGGVTLEVYIDNPEEKYFGEPFRLHYPLSSTVMQLEETIASHAPHLQQCFIAFKKDYQGFSLLNSPKRTLRMERFYKFAKIFVTETLEDDSAAKFLETNFHKKLESYDNTIKLKVKLPENDTLKEEILIKFDKRCTLADFKARIHDETNLEPSSFKVYRVCSNNQEYERSRMNDTFVTLVEETKMVIRMVEDVLKAESPIKIFLMDLSAEQPVKFFCDGYSTKEMTVKDLKAQILPKLKEASIETTLSRMRVGRKSHSNICKFYTDERKVQYLHEDEFLIHLSKEEIPFVENGFLSLYIRRWKPSSCTFGLYEEIFIEKNSSVDTLKQKIFEKHGIPEEQILLTKGSGSFPCEVSALEMNHQFDTNITCDNINEYPLMINESGYVLFYCDSKEEKKELTNAEIAEIKKKEKKPSTSPTSRSHHRKERALKIYTNGDTKNK